MPTRSKKTKATTQSATSSKKVMVSIYGADEDDKEEREVLQFESDPAYVKVNAGVTKNLGNYESLRVDVSISVPCYVEVVQETFDAVAEQVSELLADEVDNYLDDKG